MARTELLLTAPVPGSNSRVSIELIPHDHKVARTLGHPAGAGRWVDRWNVKITPDLNESAVDGRPLIQGTSLLLESLEVARDVASGWYRAAADRAAAHHWALAERNAPHYHADQDINAG